ncbi:hypothetical protein [Montanilutibacter psychrotolerans]|uniref:hypothetical protein n=1 Tax=Montanilutibacter psychrotolerans TaxID=1327343 RepID=UPI00168109A1|nr:hypothetical protein [Lysobacter psychrotolerans]
MAAVYQLPDEPLPSGLSRWAVDPLWPLLATMLGGTVFGSAWFVFNGLALGSPTRNREWAALALSALGSCALLYLLNVADWRDWLGDPALRYAGLSIIALKLAVAYSLYFMQARCFELWEYFGGVARNGAPLLILLAVFAPRLVDFGQLHPLLAVMLR